MNNIKRISVIVLLWTTISCGQKKSMLPDYLNVGKVIVFDNVEYNLAWTSHPSDNYYKQEYLAEKDTIEKFKKLILFEVVTGTTQLKDAVASKVAELKILKKSDPIVDYDVFEKDGEIMLDFLLSKNSSDQKDLDVIERNVYRYKSFSDSNGKEGVLLFGVSERAYGDDISTFLMGLKENRFDLPNAMGAFVIPEITIKKNN